jgi:hypothetical protein
LTRDAAGQLIEGGGRQGQRLGVEEDRFRRRRCRGRQQAGKAQQLGVPVIDEGQLLAC